MDLFNPFILLGIFTGIISGLVGIGGGLITVPVLVYLFGFSQHLAQGTTLAMLIPPIGLFATYSYYQQGQVNLKVALLIALGFVIGSYFGAKYALQLPDHLLTKIFGFFLLIIAFKMIFQ